MEAKLSSRGSMSVATCNRLCIAPSTGCRPDVSDIHTSYVSRQCTSSDGDSVAPCLLMRLATPDWLLPAS
ncbi:hypothetical protein Tco_0596511 [Tanacetum coccineum]